MITIDLDNKFAIVSDGEVIKLVQKDGRKKELSVLSWGQTYKRRFDLSTFEADSHA